MVPSYLIEQEIDYIEARGFSFRDFSPEQVLTQLKLKQISDELESTQYGKFSSDALKRRGFSPRKGRDIAGRIIWEQK